MTRIDTVELTLLRHRAAGFAFDDECRCGWAIPEVLRDGIAGELMRPDRAAHRHHVAQAILTALEAL